MIEARDALRHVRWLGGGSGAGKSTIAAQIADRDAAALYDTDATIRAHIARSTPERRPLASAFVAMDMDERWLNRSPEVMLATFHGFQGELFDGIVEDLLALPSQPLILAEGFRLLPRLVAPLLTAARQAAWLLPTPEFRRMAFEARGSTWTIAGQTSNPARALENLLARDAMFTAEIARDVAALGLTGIEVDGTVGVEELADRVRAALGIGS